MPEYSGGSSGSGATTAGSPGFSRVEDGVTTNLATVQAFHNGDNQAVGGSANGLLTGGVAQLINAIQNLDRQRETGTDGIPAVGIATGTSQLASAFGTTVAATQTAGANKVLTPAAMSGTNRGVAWSIQVGSVLSLDAGANAETVVVIAVAATTFTVTLAKGHTGPFAVAGFVYNQARDSTLADGASPGGAPAGTAYFWNSALNAGAGGLEIERSAAGELDGASGAGTAVAAEYEWNGGGPVLASGLVTGSQFDRARSLQAKGQAQFAITSTAIGDANIVFSAAANTKTLQPGQAVLLTSFGVVVETVYVSSTWVPGASATVPLANPVVNATNNAARWDIYAPNGPGLNGFTPVGVGIEEEALYDPVSGQFYIERSATQDAMAGANIVAESPALWNGATFDRAKGYNGSAQVTTAPFTAPASGALAGSVTAAQLPNIACRMVKFKARAANTGRVYIGAAGVTVPGNGTDATSGLELSAQEETGWIPVDNLNRFYRICNNATDNLTYMTMA